MRLRSYTIYIYYNTGEKICCLVICRKFEPSFVVDTANAFESGQCKEITLMFIVTTMLLVVSEAGRLIPTEESPLPAHFWPK